MPGSWWWWPEAAARFRPRLPNLPSARNWANIEGVEVDGAGNIYIADGQNIGNGDNMVEKVSATSAPLNFPFTNVGSSSVPQSVKVTNIGNQSVTFTSVSAATDYPLQTGGTCTMTGSSGQSLASSANCSLSYAFHPTTGGVLNEAATLNDNNLNVSNSHQPIAFTGTGVGGTNPQLTSINPPSGTSGTSVTVTGTNLSGATEMTFGSTPVTPTSSTSTTVTGTRRRQRHGERDRDHRQRHQQRGIVYLYRDDGGHADLQPGAGTYTTIQTVTISDSTSGATIYYTTNGTTPTTSLHRLHRPHQCLHLGDGQGHCGCHRLHQQRRRLRRLHYQSAQRRPRRPSARQREPILRHKQ